MRALLSRCADRRALWALLGASTGFADFYLRHPEELAHLAGAGGALPTARTSRGELLDVGGRASTDSPRGDESAWFALRVRYRRLVADRRLRPAERDPVEARPPVAAPRGCRGRGARGIPRASPARASQRRRGAGLFPRDQVAATQLAIIGMGKAGARELNYVSDVDVIFVAGADDARLRRSGRAGSSTSRPGSPCRRCAASRRRDRAAAVGGRREPSAGGQAGRAGAHPRLASGVLRPLGEELGVPGAAEGAAVAGDPELGEAYIAPCSRRSGPAPRARTSSTACSGCASGSPSTSPPTRCRTSSSSAPAASATSSSRCSSCSSCTACTDDRIRQRGTLDALDALVAEGYIGAPRPPSSRATTASCACSSTACSCASCAAPTSCRAPGGTAGARPRDRARRHRRDRSGAVGGGQARGARHPCPPLLPTAAFGGRRAARGKRPSRAEQAHDRLAAIGFRDPAGALRHIAALTSGLSRKAKIQRHLMPVMIRWFADGVDPDYGLLAFRRISERLGNTPWFLRMLRDSSGAAESLTRVLSGSRYVGELMEWIPESVAWLDDRRAPPPAHRRGDPGGGPRDPDAPRHGRDAMRSVRALRRRELLRTAMAAMLGVLSIEQVARRSPRSPRSRSRRRCVRCGVRSCRPRTRPRLLGHRDGPIRRRGARVRLGRRCDVRLSPNGVDPQRAHELGAPDRRGAARALRGPPRAAGPRRGPPPRGPQRADRPLAGRIHRVLPPVVALVGGAGAAAGARRRGKRQAHRAFRRSPTACATPQSVDPQGLREIKRIKARVEKERLPQGVERARHLKLGPGRSATSSGSCSCCSSSTPTPAGLADHLDDRRAAAAAEAGLVRRTRPNASRGVAAGQPPALREHALPGRPATCCRPTAAARRDRPLLEYPPRSATQVEEDYLGTTRRARRVFEKLFYG